MEIITHVIKRMLQFEAIMVERNMRVNECNICYKTILVVFRIQEKNRVGQLICPGDFLMLLDIGREHSKVSFKTFCEIGRGRKTNVITYITYVDIVFCFNNLSCFLESYYS